MEIIKVGIALDDRCFAEALAKGLARECRNMTFSLVNWEERSEWNIVLTSQPSEEGNLVQLTDDPEENRLEQPPFRLYRFTDSEQMINDLLFVYFKMTGKVVRHRGSVRCKLMVITAEGGGCGTTVTALSLTKMMYRLYGRKGIYLNLCPIDDSKKYLKEEGDSGLLRLLYYLDTEQDFPVESFITHNEEMDFINTGLINSYFDQMKPVLMDRLLKKLVSLGIYDFLTIDVGNHLSRENKRLIQEADGVIYLKNDRFFFPGKYGETISREIQQKTGKGLFLPVLNFVDDCHDEETEEICISQNHSLREITSYELLDIPLSKGYGIEIATLANRIIDILE